MRHARTIVAIDHASKAAIVGDAIRDIGSRAELPAGIRRGAAQPGATPMSYAYLAIAIIAEVVGTSALKASEEFTRLVPSMIVVAGYAVAFFFLSLTLRTIPVGIAYAIWAGAGVALIVAASAVLFRQVPDVPAMIGVALIVAGVVVVNTMSRMPVH
jgi:small multidrug resistance pump